MLTDQDGTTLAKRSGWTIVCLSTALAACPGSEPLIEKEAPRIEQDPASLTVAAPATATFTVIASGGAPLTYQWKRNGIQIPAATAASYTTGPTTIDDDGATFSVTVKNELGEAQSSPAILGVKAAPSIVAHPQDISVSELATATFSVTAIGTAPLFYQWMKNGAVIPGATEPSYTTPPASLADDDTSYSVTVRNDYGMTTSNSAQLSVDRAPVITMQPTDQRVALGTPALFTVGAEGTEPLRYQWKKNGAEIVGATAASYTTEPTVRGDDGAIFTVVVANNSGQVESEPASLGVDPPLVFVPTVGPMFTARSDHTATELADGRILVIGGLAQGRSPRDVLASAELYDPATGTFTPTGALKIPRYAHTATRLLDGSVLVVGGYCDGCGGALARSERYDPQTGVFEPAAILQTGRARHTATLLISGPRAGQLVIAGGSQTERWASDVEAVEVYNHATRRFTTVARLIAGRFDHSATLLESGAFAGQILLVGGRDDDSFFASTILYSAEFVDVDGGRTTDAGAMTSSRFRHSATLLPDGRVMIAGGSGPYDGSRELYPALSTIEIYDPSKLEFEDGGRLLGVRAGQFAHLYTAGPHLGKVLLIGGYDDAGSIATGEIYDFTVSRSVAGPSLHTPRWRLAGLVRENQELVVIGGKNNDDKVAGAELGHWSRDQVVALPIIQAQPADTSVAIDGSATFSVQVAPAESVTFQWLKNGEIIPSAGLSSYTTGIVGPLDNGSRYSVVITHEAGVVASRAAVLSVFTPVNTTALPWVQPNTRGYYGTRTLLQSGRVLLAGGSGQVNPDATELAEVYDPSSGQYVLTGPMNEARLDHSATLLADGRVLVCGGVSGLGQPGGLATAEVFDPVVGSFTAAGDMTEPRREPVATLLASGHVLVVSGATAELFNPATGTFAATGHLAQARRNPTLARLNDGRVLILGDDDYYDHNSTSTEIYDPSTGGWSSGASLEYSRGQPSATLLESGEVLILGGYGAIENSASSNLGLADVYDPATNHFTPAALMTTWRGTHTATPLPSGKVLLVGGSDVDVPIAELYDPLTRAFTDVELTATSYYDHGAFSLGDGRVLILDHWPGNSEIVTVH